MIFQIIEKKLSELALFQTYDDFMTNATQFISGITNQEKGQEVSRYDFIRWPVN